MNLTVLGMLPHLRVHMHARSSSSILERSIRQQTFFAGKSHHRPQKIRVYVKIQKGKGTLRSEPARDSTYTRRR